RLSPVNTASNAPERSAISAIDSNSGGSPAPSTIPRFGRLSPQRTRDVIFGPSRAGSRRPPSWIEGRRQQSADEAESHDREREHHGGDDDEMRMALQVLKAFADHEPPAGPRRLHADPDEA